MWEYWVAVRWEKLCVFVIRSFYSESFPLTCVHVPTDALTISVYIFFNMRARVCLKLSGIFYVAHTPGCAQLLERVSALFFVHDLCGYLSHFYMFLVNMPFHFFAIHY